LTSSVLKIGWYPDMMGAYMSKTMAGRESLRLIKELYRYNSRTRKRYLRVIFRKVPEKERYRDRGASFPSIVDIFIHIIDAYRFWFLFVYPGKVREYRRLRETEKFTERRAREEEEKMDSYMHRFLGSLKPADLKRRVRLGRRTLTLRDILVHMVEEELQHRGELNALPWQMDVEPPLVEWGG